MPKRRRPNTAATPTLTTLTPTSPTLPPTHTTTTTTSTTTASGQHFVLIVNQVMLLVGMAVEWLGMEAWVEAINDDGKSKIL